ncbi:glycosyltransferase family 2 protein [Zhihengliuella sp.]|uniref:glycosyltransferase family 2 protein n=1 Tax=Zhihengliuella sp. TaxID=1954483 RepID=UPI002811B3E1|nr:glycosyltransferase family 2 protein [Zhihengliuella sp.]
MPRVRALERRALRDLGRAVGTRAPPAAEASGLISEHVRVTAVVATHNGAAFLPRTLEALAAQTRPVDACIGVDASSRDGSADLLEELLPDGATVVRTVPRGFGHSVAEGLRGRLPEAQADLQDWIWLIHDDSAPAHDALEHLLRAVETSPSVTIAGCKQLDADRPRRLLDVGLSMSRAGERLTMIEADELDQGQYDNRSDAFAVNSAGLLIRRDAWELLDGFDPALPGIGDDLDLAWRNRLAGHRVVVVPRARMYHVADAVKSISGPLAARRSQVYLRLKHAPALAVPFIAIGALLGGLGRFLAGLVAKDPGYGAGQLAASFLAVFSPVGLVRSRRRAARTRRQRRSAVKPLMTDRRDVREHRRHQLTGAHHDGVVGDGAGSSLEASNPSGDANDDFAAIATPHRTSSIVSAILATGAALVLSLVGLRHVIGAAAVSGGSALPVTADLSDLWTSATTWWQSTGAGIGGPPDPFDLVLVMLGGLGLGHTNAAVTVFALAAMPLAAVFAWLALGAVTGSRAIRLIGALLWALAPALQAALAGGRLGAVVVHVLLPLVALGMVRSIGGARRRGQDGLNEYDDAGAPERPGVGGVPSWTAAAGAALALAAVVSAAPALLVPAIAATVALALATGRRARTLWWVPVPALAATAGLIAGAFENPRVLFADPGLPQAFTAAPLWQRLLGFPEVLSAPAETPSWLPAPWAGADLLPWILVGAALVALPVLAFAIVGALLPARAGWAARAGWTVAVVGLAASLGAQLIATGLDQGVAVTPYTGSFVSVALIGLLIAAAIGATQARQPDAVRDGRPALSGGRRGLVNAGAVLAVLALVLTAGGWLAAGSLHGPGMRLEAAPERTLPATAADRGTGEYQTRTLVIDQREAGVIQASLVSGGGATLDASAVVAQTHEFYGSLLEQQRREDDAATTALRATVAAIVSGQGIDPREDLRDLGVAFVVLDDTSAGGEFLASQINVVPGLASVGRTGAGWLWRVHDAAGEAEGTGDFAARVRIENDGVVQHLVENDRGRVADESVPAGSTGRVVVLAERADTGWHATFNGRPLHGTTAGWAQAFELPPVAGELRVWHVSPLRLPIAILQVAVLILTVLLVLPFRARRRAAVAQPRWRHEGHAEEDETGLDAADEPMEKEAR